VLFGLSSNPLPLLLLLSDASRNNNNHQQQLSNLPTIKQLHATLLPLFIALRYLSCSIDPAVRAQSQRCLRYVVCDRIHTLPYCYSLRLDSMIIRCLERESKYLWERMQSFKLYKKMIQLAPQKCTRRLLQSIVALCEVSKDDFKRVSLNSVRELILLQPRLVCRCNGIRLLMDTLLDCSPAAQQISNPPQSTTAAIAMTTPILPLLSNEASHSLTLTLLYLLDNSKTRRYFRPHVDLSRLLTVFTDVHCADSPEREARRLQAHNCLLTCFRII
jgi:hypothetical protein